MTASRGPLAGGRPTALAAGGLLLRGRPALLRRAPALPRARCLSTPLRRSGGVGDPRRALLRHPLLLQRFVLLLVLDARPLVRHRDHLPIDVDPSGFSFPDSRRLTRSNADAPRARPPAGPRDRSAPRDGPAAVRRRSRDRTPRSVRTSRARPG